MDKSLILFININNISGIVLSKDNKFNAISSPDGDFFWLYFFNNLYEDKVSYSKSFEKNFRNNEPDYYGDLWKNLEGGKGSIHIRSHNLPLIEILKESGFIEDLKKEFFKGDDYSNPEINKVKTHLCFTNDIKLNARTIFREFLERESFEIASDKLIVPELAVFSLAVKKKLKLESDHISIVFNGLNNNLKLDALAYNGKTLSKLSTKENEFPGKGRDPRKSALVKYVIDSINRDSGLLTEKEQFEIEYVRMESNADEWIKKLDNSGNAPLMIPGLNFSVAPGIIKDVIINPRNIETDTGRTVQELLDIFNHFLQQNNIQIKDLSAVVFLGDSLNNDLVLKRFKTKIEENKIVFASTKDLFEILAEVESFNNRRENESLQSQELEEQQKLEEKLKIKQQKELEERINLEELKKSEEKLRLEQQKEIEEKIRIEEQKKYEEKLRLEAKLRLEQQKEIEESLIKGNSAHEVNPKTKTKLLIPITVLIVISMVGFGVWFLTQSSIPPPPPMKHDKDTTIINNATTTLSREDIAYINEMMEKFNEIISFENNANPKQSLKSNWSNYISKYTKDVSNSKDDDEYRKQAEEKLKYWENYENDLKFITTMGEEFKRILSIEDNSKQTQALWTNFLSMYNKNIIDFQEDDEYRAKANERLEYWKNYIHMPLVDVASGTFKMGDVGGGFPNEKPLHQVSLSNFSIGKFEITTSTWKRIMGERDSNIEDKKPITNVSWIQAIEFCNKLSTYFNLNPYYSIIGSNVRINQSANGYRLPTEAEWEYAARGGSRSTDKKYSGSSEINEVANYQRNSSGAIVEVGTKKPNELGIHDMSGNAAEWCWDYFGGYFSNSQDDPTGPTSGERRVFRGGSVRTDAINCRVSHRDKLLPSKQDQYIGFRVARNR